MREIKFKAWDKEQKVMFAIDAEQFVAGHDFFNNDRFIPLQYTGLLDKSGVEIYEGDIIKDGDVIGEVRYDTPSFDFEPNNKKDKHYFSLGWSYNSEGQPLFEIVGNIYENKDLLT